MKAVFQCTLFIALYCEVFSGSNLYDDRNSAVGWYDFLRFIEDVYSQSHEEKKLYHDKNPVWNKDLYRKYYPEHKQQSDIDTFRTEPEEGNDEVSEYLLHGVLEDSKYDQLENFQPQSSDIDETVFDDDIVQSNFVDSEEDKQRLLSIALLEDMIENAEESSKQTNGENELLEDFSEEGGGEENQRDERDKGFDVAASEKEGYVTSDRKKERGKHQDKKSEKESTTKDNGEERRVVVSETLPSSDEEELQSLLNKMVNAEVDKIEASDVGNGTTVVGENINIALQLPGISINQDDTYLCTAVKIDDYTNSYNKSVYITKYVPHAKQTVAHHMLLYGCASPGLSQVGAVWNCGGTMKGTKRGKFRLGSLCGSGQSTILWAWAKDAPAFTLPKDIGFKVGAGTNVRYFVLQVHYKSASVFRGGMKDHSGVTIFATKQRQPLLAGVYILASSMGTVEPHQKKNFDIQCRYTQPFSIHPFAFRTHTHGLGQEVIGFRIRDADWTLIGAKNPQLPEAFYPVATKNITIKFGDILAARCIMGNFRNVPTSIGWRHTDEMCNFYIMFWVDSKYENQLDSWTKSCSTGYPWVHWSSLPGYDT